MNIRDATRLATVTPSCPVTGLWLKLLAHLKQNYGNLRQLLVRTEICPGCWKECSIKSLLHTPKSPSVWCMFSGSGNFVDLFSLGCLLSLDEKGIVWKVIQRALFFRLCGLLTPLVGLIILQFEQQQSSFCWSFSLVILSAFLRQTGEHKHRRWPAGRNERNGLTLTEAEVKETVRPLHVIDISFTTLMLSCCHSSWDSIRLTELLCLSGPLLDFSLGLRLTLCLRGSSCFVISSLRPDKIICFSTKSRVRK